MQELEKAGIHGSFKGDSKFFSKNVKVSMMFKSNEWRNFSGALVEFEASARSAWHTHPQGQTLIVTEGEIITKVPGQKAFIASLTTTRIYLISTGAEHRKELEKLQLVS